MPNLKDLPDGKHRLFTRGDDTYILDETGDSPETTKGGPMKLNRQTPLVLQGNQGMIPALDEDGIVQEVNTDPQTVVNIAADFAWRVTDGENLFAVQRSGEAG